MSIMIKIFKLEENNNPNMIFSIICNKSGKYMIGNSSNLNDINLKEEKIQAEHLLLSK